MTDTPSRRILGLNQQTYQRLKLALGLGLRRQIFVAVCDDLPLRDRLAAQLEAELMQLSSASQAEQYQLAEGTETFTTLRRYPRLISLHLSHSDPNPVAQMARWLAQFPPPQIGNRRAPMPAFQLLGIEHLTRQPAAIQRLFFTHLQGIERSLPMLESSLLLWLPQPWFRALPQSAPEFWRCRTGIFEFVGDPTPLPPENVREPSDHALTSSKPSHKAPVHKAPVHKAPIVSRHKSVQPGTPVQSETVSAQAAQSAGIQDDWTSLLDDLDRLDELYPDDRPTAAPVTAQSKLPLPDRLVNPPKPPVSGSTISQNGASQRDRPASTANPATTRQAPKPVFLVQPPPANQPVDPAAETAAHEPTEAPALPFVPAAPPETKDLSAATLQQQIEQLHQQKAPPGLLANAYRTLGNLYRDRVEQGDVSLQNLSIAIDAYEQTLQWMHGDSPLWVDVLNDVGNLYWMLARSVSTLEQALSALHKAAQSYQTAITKLNPQTQPHMLSMVQNNLGAAYADLARYDDPAGNLQRSVNSYQQALRYRKAEEEPQRYASTQNNLGTTYWNLAQHTQPVVHLKQAIGAYSEALRYYNPEQEPLNYAMIQNNLGTAYWNLAQHERPKDWLMLALGAYRMALRYRTQAVNPTAFAATQNNLGTAYWHLANHSKEDANERLGYLQQAIAAYESALSAAASLAEQTTSSLQPLGFDLFATHNNLGLAHHQVATDPRIALSTAEQSTHLEAALNHHLQALDGWQHKAEFRQTALNCILQTVRSFYSQCGISGQNLALSSIPGYLLPEILPSL
ncbi:tetratricopeptide repeat protein [Oculatella sp. LEGE 06141]|uniref:tetratricopeptide repeat protein n=1 Tax=Oculatella sp. LEGE 06141 TaxID=1828648 RepID=UPI00187FADFA|nr:tetratricopeptide repeat protein [Oculatella sp. LEGE 06141]